MLSHLGCNSTTTKQEEVTGKTVNLKFQVASEPRVRKWAPPATPWCPASHYSQLHFSTAHADAILEHGCSGVGDVRRGGKTTLLMFTCCEKRILAWKTPLIFLQTSHKHGILKHHQMILEDSLQTKGLQKLLKKGLPSVTSESAG